MNPKFFSALVALTTFALACSPARVNAQASIVITPATPVAYEPLTVTATFSKAHCLSDVYPLIGEVTYENKTLSVVLSHLKAGPCKTKYDFKVPGLPSGTQTLKVIVSARAADPSEAAVVAETVQTTAVVGPLPGASSDRLMWTGRIDGDGFMNPFNLPIGSKDGPIVLWSDHGSAVFARGDWLEIGYEVADAFKNAYTFKTFGYSGIRSKLPESLTPLYSLQYPSPLLGLFYTANIDVFNRLVREWNRGPEIIGDPVNTFPIVGKLVDGICPIGMTPVYQAFHQQALAHRYTQSAIAYRTLIANGYKGEGPQWCAPAR